MKDLPHLSSSCHEKNGQKRWGPWVTWAGLDGAEAVVGPDLFWRCVGRIWAGLAAPHEGERRPRPQCWAPSRAGVGLSGWGRIPLGLDPIRSLLLSEPCRGCPQSKHPDPQSLHGVMRSSPSAPPSVTPRHHVMLFLEHAECSLKPGPPRLPFPLPGGLSRRPTACLSHLSGHDHPV